MSTEDTVTTTSPPESTAADGAAAYTVVGVWLDDTPVPVGVIAGEHTICGGNDEQFPEGLWATSVNAEDADAAETAAVAEMLDSV